MARCKDCIHGECCSVFIPVRTTLCNDRADKMCELFKHTADVVPKSEVEEWQKVYADSQKKWEEAYEKLEQNNIFLQKTIAENAQRSLEVILEEIEKAKAETAREIFEEIENALFNNHCLDEWSDYPTPHYYEELEDDIAELKKKYIGE